jgi:hypothetical protein
VVEEKVVKLHHRSREVSRRLGTMRFASGICCIEWLSRSPVDGGKLNPHYASINSLNQTWRAFLAKIHKLPVTNRSRPHAYCFGKEQCVLSVDDRLVTIALKSK